MAEPSNAAGPGGLLILQWKCPFCAGGLGPSLDGGAERCMHCAGVGLTDDPCGDAERAPRPPGVMRAPCGDCAFRCGSPELDNQGVQLPDDEPFFCHQGLPVNASGTYTPVAMFRGLPLGAMVCAGWWAMRTGEPLPGKPYREIPITEDQVEARWAPKKPRLKTQPQPAKGAVTMHDPITEQPTITDTLDLAGTSRPGLTAWLATAPHTWHDDHLVLHTPDGDIETGPDWMLVRWSDRQVTAASPHAAGRTYGPDGLHGRLAAADAAIERVRAALDSFKDRGVMRIGYTNADVPTAGEVIDTVRVALDELTGR